MAENKTEEKKEDQVEEKADEKAGAADGLGDDLMDLFGSEAEVVDPTLAMLTASLDEVDLEDLLEQVREIQDIINQRRAG